MKILHCIPDLNLSSGGPSLSVWSLVTGLRRLNIDVDIVTYESQDGNDKMIGEGLFVKTIPSPRFRRFGYSAYLNNFLQNTSHEIYHGNGLWQYPVHAMAKTARKKNKPYIISPHGMLYPEALQNSAWFKKLAMLLYQKKDLKKATVLHATCKQELEHFRQLGLTNPVAVIPNSIDIKIPGKQVKPENQKKRVGYVGRFDPIKNIENLIKAWSETGKYEPGWELVLIGDGETSYKASLVRLVEKLDIKNIVFTGFLNGEEKGTALQSLNYLVLPSKSENFGMVVPEALIREIPVIASKGTPWEELNTYNAGWWIDIGVQPLVETLHETLNLSEEQRQQMGQNGRKLVEEKYSIEAVAAQMIQLYKWILNGGEKPQFVYAKS
jgi:glycosyltransferase involved in cell wall biosynthesis